MIDFLTTWKRDGTISVASRFAGLAFVLAVGSVSMSVLFQSENALAVDDCGEHLKYSADRRSGDNGPACGYTSSYQPGSERDDSGFPLTADENGNAPSSPSEGNIVYSMRRNFIALQTYTPSGATAAVLRPWWQATCTTDSGQMCWTTIAGTVTAPPSDAEIFYRLTDANGNIDYTGDYAAGPPASHSSVTTQIAVPSTPTGQVATKKLDGSNLADADHNVLFLNADSPIYPGTVSINVGWADGATVRGIKERIVLINGIPTRVPRTLVGGEDEDGFGRYALTFDVSTSIGLRIRRGLITSSGRADDGNDNTIIEGGADKISKIDNLQINEEGGSLDGGGINFGGDAEKLEMILGSRGGSYVTRDTVIARSKGEDSDFHAVYFHQDTQRGGSGEFRMLDVTLQMLNGDSSPAPEEGRGLIVTTGNDSSGITISVANPVGDEDDEGESTGGIAVQVDTPVKIKTGGMRSHGIVLNLGFGEGQEENTDLYQRAALLMEAVHRDTALSLGMTEGTVNAPLNNLATSSYSPSVRIATNGHRSGGVVMRNSDAGGEAGTHVRLGGIVGSGDASLIRDFPDGTPDYSLVVDKSIVTTGAGSHGVVASIAESGITLVVSIKNLDDGDASNGVEQTISVSGADSLAFSGTGSMGKFTMNVQGHVTGDIVTGDRDDTITVGDAGADAEDEDDDLAPTITGDIDAGGGDDTVNIMFGSVTGTVGSGSGCDTVTLSAGVSVGGVNLGLCEDEDKKNVLNTDADIEGDVAASGVSELNLAGREVGSVTLTGSGTTTVNGGTLGGIVFSGNEGTDAKVVVGTRTNPVTITGDIEGGAGNDEVELAVGTVFSVDNTETDDENEASMISMGAGNDTLTYTAMSQSATATGDAATMNARRNLPAVNMGDGCDTVTLTASGSTTEGMADSTAGSINLGGCSDGMDRLTSNIAITGDITTAGNSMIRLNAGGSLGGSLTLGDGDDDVAVATGYGFETIDLGAGSNRFTSRQTDPLTSIVSSSVANQTTEITLNVGGVGTANSAGSITLGDGNDILTWNTQARVFGNVNLGGGDNTVNGNGMFNGAIVGGGGDDTVTLTSGTVSSMTGVETFTKDGNGVLNIGSMSNPAASASTLSGSTTAAGEAVTVNVNDGKLVVSGHLNLGTAGTLTVVRGAKLVFDVTGAASQYADGGTASHGRITAGEVVISGPLPEIELATTAAGTRAVDEAAATMARLFQGATKVVSRTGGDAVTPAIVRGGDNGANPVVIRPGAVIVPGPGDTTVPSGGGVAGDDDDNTAIYAVGALAVLWWVMRRDDMGGDNALVDYESGVESSFASASGLDNGMKTWANYYSDSTAPVQGLAVGVGTPVSSNGSLSFTAMPEAKGSLNLSSLSLNQKSSFQGGHYSVKGQWNSEDYFTTAELSYADAASSTSFDNLAAGGRLGGKFDMTSSHLEIGAGAKLQLTDTVSVTPTVGFYGGSISQGEFALSGQSMVASMSRQEQSYTGWNLGLRVQPDSWTTGGTKFQPRLSMNTFRTSSNVDSFELRQSDKAGVLNFSSQLPVQGMPAIVNTFRAGMTMKSESGLDLNLDYVGMEINGELQHGAIARILTKF